jgi:hypothetical protein
MKKQNSWGAADQLVKLPCTKDAKLSKKTTITYWVDAWVLLGYTAQTPLKPLVILLPQLAD